MSLLFSHSSLSHTHSTTWTITMQINFAKNTLNALNGQFKRQLWKWWNSHRKTIYIIYLGFHIFLYFVRRDVFMPCEISGQQIAFALRNSPYTPTRECSQVTFQTFWAGVWVWVLPLKNSTLRRVAKNWWKLLPCHGGGRRGNMRLQSWWFQVVEKTEFRKRGFHRKFVRLIQLSFVSLMDCYFFILFINTIIMLLNFFVTYIRAVLFAWSEWSIKKTIHLIIWCVIRCNNCMKQSYEGCFICSHHHISRFISMRKSKCWLLKSTHDKAPKWNGPNM